jgi:transposase
VKAPAQVGIGVDAHKRTHTLVVADELGRELASKTLAATAEGHLAAIAWADRWPSRRWAIEDCRHLTRTLEAALLRAGERVVRVPTQMMAGVRRSARTRGKSDAIDALAIARAAWRERLSGLLCVRPRRLWSSSVGESVSEVDFEAS